MVGPRLAISSVTYLLHGAESFLRSELVLQLIKKFPAFYGTRKFITVLTSARHLSLSSANSIQSPQPLPTSWRSILILSSHVRLGSNAKLLNLTLYGPCIVIYLRNKNLSFLIYSNKYPLHVSNRLTIYPQQAVYCTCSMWYSSCVYVDWLLTRSWWKSIFIGINWFLLHKLNLLICSRNRITFIKCLHV